MSILTANFSSDIREKMNGLVDALKDKGFSNMGQDQVLKTCLLLIGKDTTFELKNFNKNNIKEIEDNWEKITDSIYNAAKLLETFGYASYLGSAYILSSLAYFYFLNSKMNESDKEQALKFVRNAQITSYFSSTTDTKLSAIAHSIKEAQTFESFNHNLAKHEKNPLKITNYMIEEMVNYKYSDNKVFPILQILYPNLNYKTTTFHIDHIYPKSKFNEKNEKLDQDFYEWKDYLFNLQLLEGAENIAKKDKDPEVWLKEEYKDEQAIEEYKKRNYIDPTLKLEWENIKEFREKREEAIITKLKEVLLPKS
ncbi:ancestral polypeptide [Helicobacter pylori]|nr:ancestral polypeptide [Helicobacter pylori]